MKRLLAAALMFAALSASAQSLDLYPIGKNFGSRGQWQFGLDKSATLGACTQRELHDGQWLVGPCRDFLLLTKDGNRALHLGGAVLYNAEHGNPSYSLRAGINVGTGLGSLLRWTVQSLPYVEKIADVKPPKFMAYLGSIATIDYAVGWRPVHSADVNGNITHGPMAKLDIPMDDLLFIQKVLGF